MAALGVTDEAGQWLLARARESIGAAVRGEPLAPASHRPAGVDAPGASFVTLTLDGQLRGCIGSLEASRPLFSDVSDNARAAALKDPRFAPVTEAELDRVAISVSVLAAPERLPVSDRQALKQQLTPGIHGLTISAGHRRATFLPSVWAQLPDADDFIDHLRQKAGLPDSWPDSELRCERYTVTCFDEQTAPAGCH
jgi:AmmeMemoRadiSam system protein A